MTSILDYERIYAATMAILTSPSKDHHIVPPTHSLPSHIDRVLHIAMRSALVVLVLELLNASWVQSWCPSFLPTQTPAFQRRPTTLLYNSIDFDSLMDMDIVVYSLSSSETKRQLGAIQEDGSLAPLVVWTTEPVFGDSYFEFLVDEEDRFPGLKADDVILHSIVQEDALSYGSRQVGGGMGPSNPHGEESELLYYVDQKMLEGIELIVRPELEIFW